MQEKECGDAIKAAVEVLVTIAEKSEHQRACDALIPRLEEESHVAHQRVPVICSAMEGIGQVAQKGDRQACDALIVRMQEGREQQVRAWAAKTLREVAAKGDEASCGALITRLTEDIRCQAFHC